MHASIQVAAQCFIVRMSSTLTVPRLRKTAMTMARPMAASAAATAMTKKADTWPTSVAAHAREGEEGEVGGVEHQLDAHEDHQRVAADQHAEHAQAEEQRGEEQVVLEWGPLATDAPFQMRDLATTTAPTMATSRSRRHRLEGQQPLV